MKTVFAAVILMFASFPAAAYAQVKLGVALPLMKDAESSSQGSTGEMILKGITDALSEYNTSSPVTAVDIVVEDTKRDPETTLEILNKFGNDKKISAVLGPVYSNELSRTAGAALFHKLPVISPTATENFIAEKNEYVFQLNPTYDIRGRLMAKYAKDKLGMRKFVILSENAYGKMYADAFEEQVGEEGDSILYVKYYSKDDYDLYDEVGEIKNFLTAFDKFIDFSSLSQIEEEKLKASGLSPQMIDTLRSGRYFVSIYRLFGSDAEKNLSSSAVTYKPYDSSAARVIFGIADGIYIPVSKSLEAGKVALALFRNKISLPVLGTSDWNSTEILEQNAAYLKDITFESDFLLSKKFSENQNGYTDAELRNYYFGYGAMQMILSVVANGNKTREDISRAIESLTGYVAPYNKYTMIKRTNRNLNIVDFRNGKFSYSQYSY